MKKERKEKNFIKKPVYPGGSKAMKAFVNEHLQYPEEAAKHGIEGTVSLRYRINHEGKVDHVDIISGLGYGCDEEAVRVVKLLRFQVDKVRKLRVTFHKNIHVHFKKPKVKQRKQEIRYQYTTTPAAGKTEKPAAPEKKGYAYTIRFDS